MASAIPGLTTNKRSTAEMQKQLSDALLKAGVKNLAGDKIQPVVNKLDNQATTNQKALNGNAVNYSKQNVVTNTPATPLATPQPASTGYGTTVTMPDGSSANAKIINGQTYMPDGSRVPVGAIVNTKGGQYIMTANGGQKYTPPQQVDQIFNQPPQVASVDTGNIVTQTQDQLAELMKNSNATRQNQIDRLNELFSTENFTKILNDTMARYMPLFESQSQTINNAFDKAEGKIDINAERRGLYNSDVPMNQIRENDTSRNQAIQDALATLQAQGVTETNNFLNQKLNSLQTEGAWTSDDRNFAQRNLQTALDTYFKQSGLELDRDKFDYSKMDADRNFDLQVDKFDEAKANDSRYYELAKDKFSLEKASTYASNRLREAELNFSKSKFNSEIEQYEATKRLTKLKDTTEAFQGLQMLLANEGVTADMAEMFIEPYKAYDSEIYSALKSMSDERFQSTLGYHKQSDGTWNTLSGKSPTTELVENVGKVFEIKDKVDTVKNVFNLGTKAKGIFDIFN